MASDAVFNNGKVGGSGASDDSGEACGCARMAFFIATNADHLYIISGLGVDVYGIVKDEG